MATTAARLARSPGVLRDDQAAYMAALSRHAGDAANAPIAMAVIPGASGKTTMLVALVASLQRGAKHGGPGSRTTKPRSRPRQTPRIVILTSNKILLRQIKEKAAEHPKLVLSVNVDGTTTPGPATAMTYERFGNLARRGHITPDDVDALVLDEVHRSLTERRIKAVDPFLGRTYAIGATASPTFNSGKNVDRVFGAANRIWTGTAAAARAAGAIAEVTNYVIGVRLEGAEPEDPVEAALVRRKAVAEAVATALSGPCEGIADDLAGKTFLFYGQDIAHAKMFADSYEAKTAATGRSCRMICGLDEPADVEAALDGLKARKVTGLSNVLLLGEGYDLPSIRVVGNSPTGSRVRQIQQSARAQRVDRTDPEGGDRSVVIDTYLVRDGEVLGKPQWYHACVDGDSRVARPLTYTYDMSVRQLGTAPYRGLALNYDEAFDGPRGIAGGPRPTGTRPMGSGPPDDGRIHIDWSVEDVVSLRSAIFGLDQQGEGDVSVGEAVSRAKAAGLKPLDVTRHYQALLKACRDGSTTVSLIGETFHPYLRMSGSIPGVCLSSGECDLLLAALAAAYGLALRDVETTISSRYVTTRYVMTSSSRVAVFVTDAKTACRTRRPLILADGEALTVRLIGRRSSTSVAFAKDDLPRVAKHLGMSLRQATLERPEGAVTQQDFKDALGRDRSSSKVAIGAWVQFKEALKRQETEATYMGLAFHPIPVDAAGDVARRARIAIPGDEAAALAARAWPATPKAPAEGERPLVDPKPRMRSAKPTASRTTAVPEGMVALGRLTEMARIAGASKKGLVGLFDKLAADALEGTHTRIHNGVELHPVLWDATGGPIAMIPAEEAKALVATLEPDDVQGIEDPWTSLERKPREGYAAIPRPTLRAFETAGRQAIDDETSMVLTDGSTLEVKPGRSGTAIRFRTSQLPRVMAHLGIGRRPDEADDGSVPGSARLLQEGDVALNHFGKRIGRGEPPSYAITAWSLFQDVVNEGRATVEHLGQTFHPEVVASPSGRRHVVIPDVEADLLAQAGGAAQAANVSTGKSSLYKTLSRIQASSSKAKDLGRVLIAAASRGDGYLLPDGTALRFSVVRHGDGSRVMIEHGQDAALRDALGARSAPAREGFLGKEAIGVILGLGTTAGRLRDAMQAIAADLKRIKAEGLAEVGIEVEPQPAKVRAPLRIAEASLDAFVARYIPGLVRIGIPPGRVELRELRDAADLMGPERSAQRERLRRLTKDMAADWPSPWRLGDALVTPEEARRRDGIGRTKTVLTVTTDEAAMIRSAVAIQPDGSSWLSKGEAARLCGSTPQQPRVRVLWERCTAAWGDRRALETVKGTIRGMIERTRDGLDHVWLHPDDAEAFVDEWRRLARMTDDA